MNESVTCEGCYWNGNCCYSSPCEYYSPADGEYDDGHVDVLIENGREEYYGEWRRYVANFTHAPEDHIFFNI